MAEPGDAEACRIDDARAYEEALRAEAPGDVCIDTICAAVSIYVVADGVRTVQFRCDLAK